MKTKHRLRRSADFTAVREERRGAADEVLRLQVRPSSLGYPRVGITVTKRAGGAVVRNRVRRRLRAAISEMIPAIASFDLVVLPRRPAVEASARQLALSLDGCLRRAGALR